MKTPNREHGFLSIFVPLIFWPIIFLIIKHTKKGRPVDDGYLYVIIVLLFGLGWISVYVGQDFILGACVLGLAVPEGPLLGAALVEKLQFFGTSLLFPIFVTCGVMKADLSLPPTGSACLSIGGFIFITHLVKMVACVIPALLCKIPLKDALALDLILNAKGTVDVGIFSGLYDEQVGTAILTYISTYFVICYFFNSFIYVCIDAARGLHYLHTGFAQGIIHCDIKLNNILVDEDYVARVTDFSLSGSGLCINETHVSTGVKGSFGYRLVNDCRAFDSCRNDIMKNVMISRI